MFSPGISRRAALASLAAGAGACGRRKAVGYAGFALVANQEGNSVAVVDLNRFRVRWRVPLEGPPAQLVADPARPAAYALLPASGKVVELLPGRNRASRSAHVAAGAVSMRLAPDARSLWVLCHEPASLVNVPLDTLRPAARVRLAAAPVDFDISRDAVAAVCHAGQPGVTLVSLSRGAAERTAPTFAPVSVARFRFDGKHVLAGHAEARALTIIETASARTVVRLPLPLAPRNFCFSADGGQLFISGEGADAVAIVYPYVTEVAETILAGRAPEGMAAGGVPEYLFVANPETGTVTVLDIETRKLVAVVSVGREPRSIVITPDNQYALVLCQGSGDLAVVRIPALAARRYKHAPLFTMLPAGSRPVSAVVVPAA